MILTKYLFNSSVRLTEQSVTVGVRNSEVLLYIFVCTLSVNLPNLYCIAIPYLCVDRHQTVLARPRCLVGTAKKKLYTGPSNIVTH